MKRFAGGPGFYPPQAPDYYDEYYYYGQGQVQQPDYYGGYDYYYYGGAPQVDDYYYYDQYQYQY